MSKDCLITKLKGTVDNNALIKLGMIRFGIITKAAGSNSLQIGQDPQKTIIYDEAGNVLKTFTSRDDYYEIPNSMKVIVETGKYSTGYIILAGVSNISDVELDVDELKYLNYDTSFSTNKMQGLFEYPGVTGSISSIKHLLKGEVIFNTSNISGDISELASCTEITALHINGAKNITGSLAGIATLTNLTYIDVDGSGTDIKTTLKAFLDGLWTNGKRGNMTLRIGSNNIDNNAGITSYLSTVTFVEDSATKWTWVGSE